MLLFVFLNPSLIDKEKCHIRFISCKTNEFLEVFCPKSVDENAPTELFFLSFFLYGM